MENFEKVTENRLRRVSARRAMILQKAPTRDRGAVEYGTYRLLDAITHRVVTPEPEHGRGYGLTLPQIEAWLTRSDRDTTGGTR